MDPPVHAGGDGETPGAISAALAPPPLPGLKSLGLPLDERDVAVMVHKSLSNIAGHNVHFRWISHMSHISYASGGTSEID